ncbi:2-hydroxy-3-keto-5-methylthiopentenyl-1-phosphate phosphatase [Paenibacillus sp. F411]|uniref:2-hydroxy-3-keto-5-methylthiopentenyl-1- phosphate phosphatase n=1 Tax=Paenibacillus sp. F411 TaxID=2820239 RepID=UPI001AAEE939|nr:2-hydroxy-3-keto-5-methylthiopentenyl-1-phosphate phosphatase [Paenibacillus sp. F411]MBO2943131.1 2-hydroxy-3-keto-5-methylthiopentenyl-1-phosphate phosphatase [Paenibacillus sp. F411]
MMMNKQPVVFCDFDGTITDNDNIVEIMKHFLPEGYEEVMRATVERQISIKEGVGRMFALFPSSRREEIKSFALEQAVIREGFQEYLQHLQDHRIPFYVTSGGIDFFVKPLLEPFHIPEEQIYCNSADFSQSQITITWPHPCEGSCTNQCGMCKVTVMKQFPSDQYYRILIGDSITDFEGAKIADLVYSRSTLTKRCEELGVQHVPFQTFHDIIEDMKQKTLQGV